MAPRDELPTQVFDNEVENSIVESAVHNRSDDSQDGYYPDGGLQGWLMVLGGWCASFCAFGWINAIGVFQNYYQTELFPSLATSTIAWVPSMESFVLFVGCPIWGLVYDNYGPVWLIRIGTALHVFGLMMASISNSFWQLILSQGLCSPLGAGMFLSPTLGTAITWFDKRRGLALGLISSGASIGGMVYPLLFEKVAAMLGFAWAMRACAFVILGQLTITNLTVRPRIRPHPRRFKWGEYIEPFTHKTYRYLSLGSVAAYLAIFLPLNYLIVQGKREGMSEGLAGKLLVILNSVSVIGRSVPCFASDIIGRYNMTILSSLLSTALVLLIWIPTSGPPARIIFACLYGIAAGTYVSLAPALVSRICPIEKVGVQLGTLYLLMGFATLASNPVGGAIIDSEHGDFVGMQVFCGICWAVGTLGLVLARATLVGWGWKKVA